MNSSTNYSKVVIGSNGLPGKSLPVSSTQAFKDIYKTTLLGVDISRLSHTVQFILISLGVFIFFVFYGYLLEAIFVQPSVKCHGLYLTFIQFVLYSVFAYIESHIQNNTARRIPMPTYYVISFLTVATMTMSNLSLEYLNYPTQVIFKSCKLIPVLVGGIIIQGKKYGTKDFIAACVMCIGLIWFTLADVKISLNFHPAGIIMINLALVADAIIGNIQEKAMKKFGAPNSELVFYSYSIGVVYLAVALILSGRLVPAVLVANEHKLEIYGFGFLLSLTGYLGVNLVLTLVRVAGAFAAVTVTTCRKALSIIISFIFFTKPFTIQYVWAGLLVLIGVYLNLFSQRPLLLSSIYKDWMKPTMKLLKDFSSKKIASKNTINV